MKNKKKRYKESSNIYKLNRIEKQQTKAMKKKQARSWYLDKNKNGRAKTIQINYSPTIK